MAKNSILSAGLLASCMAWGPTVCGQNALKFEAASVKPAPAVTAGTGDGKTVAAKTGSAQVAGGPGSNDPGRINYPSVTLKDLVANAYDVKAPQISGPGWLDTDRYAVEATMPRNTTPEQFRVMLQNLLRERFKLALHREAKDLPTYVLRVAKNGLKMNGSVPVTVKGADGVPLSERHSIVHASVMVTPSHPSYRWIATQATMQELARNLADELKVPVADGTGLNGKYDFTINFSREAMRAAPPAEAPGVTPAEPVRDIFSAVESIGLRLEQTKARFPTIVIDHAERTPAQN